MRLVMPPGVSVPLSSLFVLGFYAVLGSPTFLPFSAGFLAGYLFYDMLHYHVHHHTPKTELGQGACASCTCATTSRTTSAATASARRSGIASSGRQLKRG